jgi:putative endonuclease
MKGWMYILECSDGSYYTGSTNNLVLRIEQHQNGEGANHTKKRLPIKLLYTEEFQRVDEAFYREKQVQGWSRKKKEALMNGEFDKLSQLSKNYTQFPNDDVTSTSSATRKPTNSEISTNTLPEPVEGNDKSVEL